VLWISICECLIFFPLEKGPLKGYCFFTLCLLTSLHLLLVHSEPLFLPVTLHLKYGPFKGQYPLHCCPYSSWFAQSPGPSRLSTCMLTTSFHVHLLYLPEEEGSSCSKMLVTTRLHSVTRKKTLSLYYMYVLEF
jgi:hypothetical protein